MKMKFLLALMAGTVALSAQAEFRKCNSDSECKKEEKVFRIFVDKYIDKEYVVKLPTGKMQDFSILKDVDIDVVRNTETGEVSFSLPKGNCPQNYLLSAFHSQVGKKDGATLAKNVVKKKCPNWIK